MKGLKLTATILVLATLVLTPKVEAKSLLTQQQLSTSKVTAQATESSANTYLQSGFDLLDAKNYQGAIEKFTQVLELDSRNIYAYVGRGTAKLYLEQYQSAKSDLDAALAIDSNVGLAYYLRGISHYFLRNKAEAIADFRQASILLKKEGKLELSQKAENAIKEIEAS